MKEDETQETSKSDIENDNNIPHQRHRVTTKGSNVPDFAETFEALRDRYQLSSNLLSNLSKNGYVYPTGIQSYGAPILLEVCSLDLLSDQSLLISPGSRFSCYFSDRYRKNSLVSPTYIRLPSCSCNKCWIRRWTWCQSCGPCAHSRISSSNPQRMSQAYTGPEMEDCFI